MIENFKVYMLNGRVEVDKGTYNVWVSKYGHIAGVAFTITGEMKSNMWYVLPTISKCWL